ncbi:cytochrome P450 [Amylostereum chailletii]|nr:cytochrome P450 [Amylostereum chailletii]
MTAFAVWLPKDYAIPAYIASALLVVSIVRYITSPRRKLPPGPPGLPIIGNIRELTDKRWLSLPDCRERYGDVMHLNAMGRSIIILNSQKAAADLLDRRAVLYSDRPRTPVFDLITDRLHFSFTPFGDLWRRMRKAVTDTFSKANVKQFHALQLLEAIIMTSDVLATPEKAHKHYVRAATSMVLQVVYDIPTVRSVEDEKIQKLEGHVERLLKASMPSRLANIFHLYISHPSSRLASWKREATKGHIFETELLNSYVSPVRADLTKGVDHNGLSAALIKTQSRNGLTDRELAWLAGSMYVAGSETTATTMSWWTLAMVAYPEVQKQAQREVDAVVGRDRIPSFADLDNMPYLRAMMREALRWRPAVPLGIPHMASEDDWYEGMYIPKGSTCLVNMWACNGDKEIYGEDVDAFNPSRHLDKDGALDAGPADTKDEGHVAFGFGRRTCVGRHVANNSLLINMAMMLWATDIRPAKDVQGNTVPVDLHGWVDEGMVL